MAFKKADVGQAAFLKMGLFGFQGSGKTWTASEMAISLHKHINSKKPVAFIDTETGSDYILQRFNKAGIALEVDKTRAFKTLIEDLKTAAGTYDILIIDSITHFWRELMRAYKERYNRRKLQIQDFGPLKDEWQQYTDLFVNSKLHILMCGRAANVFEDNEEEGEDGRKGGWKAVKVGTKMSAEGETGYEPSLLVEMQKVLIGEGGKYVRRACVVKERFGLIDSKEFDFSATDKPGFVFECFSPHIKALNLGGEHLGVDTSVSSTDMFVSPDKSVSERRRQQTVLCEEIEGLIVSLFPGQTAQEKKSKADVMQVAFGTRSWTAIQEMYPDQLEKGKKAVETLGFALSRAREEQLDIPFGPDFPRWLTDQLRVLEVMS